MPAHPASPACPATFLPQPSIRPLDKYLATSNPRVLLLVSFGERVLTANPLLLFNATGFSRWGHRCAWCAALATAARHSTPADALLVPAPGSHLP